MFGSEFRGPSDREIDQMRGVARHRIERAMVRTAGIVATRGKTAIREHMAGAGLGRLGNAIDAKADKAPFRRGEMSSASAQFFVRSRSPRTLGAIESYTEGSTITPQRGRWLWFATDNAQRLYGSGKNKRRLTPGAWRESGLEAKLGPLIRIKSVNGYPLLAVQGVGTDLSGKKPSAKSMLKRGGPRKGQVRRELLIMFVGIPSTVRQARVNITAILEGVRSELPEIFSGQMNQSGGV